MPCITAPRHRNKMTRKIIKIIVLLKTHTTTRTLRQRPSPYNGKSFGKRPRSLLVMNDVSRIPLFRKDSPQVIRAPPSSSTLPQQRSRDLRFGYRVSRFLAIAGLVDFVAWIGAEVEFNQYCWYSSCSYQTVGLPLNILLATGLLLLSFSMIVAVGTWMN